MCRTCPAVTFLSICLFTSSCGWRKESSCRSAYDAAFRALETGDLAQSRKLLESTPNCGPANRILLGDTLVRQRQLDQGLQTLEPAPNPSDFDSQLRYLAAKGFALGLQ